MLLVISSPLATFGGSITNNFDVAHDFVANGVLGDPNWDGVYLGFGDIPNGDSGDSGIGITLLADANVSFPGYLTVETSSSDWSAAGDDGFFLWKLVSGDFDVSVESAPTWNNIGFNFAGLMARAYNSNNVGSPFNPASTNGSENWVALFRFQEFGLNEVREAINGANNERAFPDVDSDTNSTRFFRMVRLVETNFTFYWKTNAGDAWVQITNHLPANGVLTRAEFAGVPMQVGIAQAMFSPATPPVYFTDFELSGPNVTTPSAPAAPSNVSVSSPNTSGSLNVAWTPGAGSDGSVVVLRGRVGAAPPIIVNPINGRSYTNDSKYMDPTAWIAGLEQVVYAGSGSSVTVSGLGGSNNFYNVAVYSYVGSGSSTIYNTASPATNIFQGPGIVSSVSFTVNPTNIPIGGVGKATIIATYSTGDSYDVSSDPSATLNSSDPSIVLISGGVMNGIAAGSTTISASYAGSSDSRNVSVHAPVFTDNFGSDHDYITAGVQGTAWDGLFLNFGDVPGAGKGNDSAAGSTSVLNANISSNNVLSIEAAGSTWEVEGSDGPFLFKVVTGDFQASVHVNSMSIINFNDAGLMARLFDNSGTAKQGGGGGVGGTETHVNWVKVQNGGLAMRETIDSTDPAVIVNGLNASDGWLLMQRVHSTNFLFFEKANASDPWIPVPAATVTLLEAADNAPMEVGILQEMRNAADGTATLDTLMIDGDGLVPPATPPPPATSVVVALNNDLSMTYSWVAASATGDPIRSALVMRAGGPITAQPTLAQAGQIGGTGSPVSFGSGVDLGGGNWLVFATGNPASSTNVTATVKNLTPGVVYYAAVYTFIGSGGNKSFNAVLPATGATANLQDGQLISISVLPPPTVPMGGIGQLQVVGNFQGGAQVNVSPFAQLTAQDTNIVVTGDGALTGLTNGTTAVTVLYGGFTNTVNVTVRPPGFTDPFGVNHDYLLNGTTGTAWDGVYLKYGDIPESTFAADVGSQGVTTWAEANISSNNCLTVTNQNGGWENAENDGFFLWKYVQGDFQMAVHITQYDIVAYTFAGIGARAFSHGTNGVDIGAPFHLNFDGAGANGECWVNFTRFDEFGIGTYPRLNIDNAVQQSIQLNQDNGDNWLLIIRQNGTNFNFYERSVPTDPWRLTPLKTSYQVPQFAGQPMQVGIQWMTFNRGGAGQDGARFDSFMLDVVAVKPKLNVALANGKVTLSWPTAVGVTLQFTPTLSTPNWQTEPTTPVDNNGTSTVVLPASAAAEFFRLVQ
jgi:hypothetical protein